MRAARIVVYVLFTLPAMLPAAAQLAINPASPESGIPLGVYGRKFTVTPKPALPTMQWSQDPAFASRPLEKPREFVAAYEMKVRLPRPLAEESVCYTARSYLYARASRHSDVTIPVGYRVCTPSTKFQVKRADLPAR